MQYVLGAKVRPMKFEPFRVNIDRRDRFQLPTNGDRRLRGPQSQTAAPAEGVDCSQRLRSDNPTVDRPAP